MRAMISWLRQCCEYVFPERGDHRIVRETTLPKLLLLLNPQSREGIVSLLPFNEPCVRAIIHEAKFQQNNRAFRLLGGVLSQYLKNSEADTLLIPIPLSSARKRERGYNQVEEILKKVDIPHLKISTGVLERNKNTKPQTTLSRHERLRNVNGAFTALDTDLAGKKIVIIDDVSTTGATLKAARATLAPFHPVSLTLLSLAR